MRRRERTWSDFRLSSRRSSGGRSTPWQKEAWGRLRDQPEAYSVEKRELQMRALPTPPAERICLFLAEEVLGTVKRIWEGKKERNVSPPTQYPFSRCTFPTLSRPELSFRHIFHFDIQRFFYYIVILLLHNNNIMRIC